MQVYTIMGFPRFRGSATFSGFPIAEPDHRILFEELVADTQIRCDIRKMALALEEGGLAPWVYFFDRHASCSAFTPVPGSPHESDIPFVFQHVDSPFQKDGVQVDLTCKVAPDDLELSAQWAGMWAAFAREATCGLEAFQLL